MLESALTTPQKIAEIDLIDSCAKLFED
jgi:hypothetical protein